MKKPPVQAPHHTMSTHLPTPPLRIIAIDPGYDRCGVAILERLSGGKSKVLFSTCIQTSKKDEFVVRMHTVAEQVRGIIDEHAPMHMALEKLFFNTNQKTAMHVVKVCGMLAEVGMAAGLEVFEYTPLQVKSAVAGSGRALKADVTRMLPLLTALPTLGPKTKRLDDEWDAIAVGITHLASYRPILYE
jgi:crossover junction endodeoxyribonuclease RuvC